ncbi:hypothetical protein PGT21_011050 [Puccinia graminis f. sp. tritici]|uniref:Uncharacterized protein n=1 Tax=Puccinia graminis f. sp. tritici TaxID=56615 RepID=A0A5B0NRZ4_PUCGR|nr:hypothetical protein PGT21_011050 [Puccinia graminis f. sp. tritici]
MKRKQRPPTPPPKGQIHEVIDLEEEEIESSQGEKVSGSGKRSWVWNHFKEDEGSNGNQAICQVVTKKGNICGKPLKKDKSGSTKTFHAHLFSFHRLVDPNLSKKTKTKHMDLKKWAKSGTLEPKASFNFFMKYMSTCTNHFLLYNM